jgi:hypothetical protein
MLFTIIVVSAAANAAAFAAAEFAAAHLLLQHQLLKRLIIPLTIDTFQINWTWNGIENSSFLKLNPSFLKP